MGISLSHSDRYYAQAAQAPPRVAPRIPSEYPPKVPRGAGSISESYSIYVMEALAGLMVVAKLALSLGLGHSRARSLTYLLTRSQSFFP